MQRICKLSVTMIFIIGLITILINSTSTNAFAEAKPLYLEIVIADKDYDAQGIDYTVNAYEDIEKTIPAEINSDYLIIEFYDNMNQLLSSEPSKYGSYKIKAIYNEDTATPTYETASEEVMFNINKRPISFILSSSTIYGSEPQWSYQYFSGSFANGENYNDLDIDFSWYDNVKMNCGSDTLEYSVIDNINYDATIYWSYVINPKKINMTIQPINITYGDSFIIQATLDENSSLCYEDDINLLNLTYYVNDLLFDNEDLSIYGAGKYLLSAQYDNSNYIINFTNNNLTINKYIAFIEVSGSAVYGTPVDKQSIYSAILTNSLVYGDLYSDLGITYYVDNDEPIVGSNYSILCNISNPNYLVQMNKAYLEVTPRQISATIDDKSIFYGDKPNFTLTLSEDSEYASGDGMHSLLVSFYGYEAGYSVREESYLITAQAKSPNYEVNFISGNLSILPKQITVNVPNIVTVYGNPIMLNYAIQNLPYNENMDVLKIGIEPQEKNVGIHQATMTYDNCNYDVTFTGGRYTIIKKSIELLIDDKEIIYGEIPDYSCALWSSTLEYSDTIEDLNISYVPESLNYGERYLISGIYDNPNYNVKFRNGRLDVAKKPITVIVDDVSIVYGVIPEFTCRIHQDSELAFGDTLASLNIALSSKGVNKIDTPRTIIRSYDNDNYDITFIDGQHIIIPRDITIKVKDISRQYGMERELNMDDIEIIEGSMVFGEPLSSLNIVFDLSRIGNVIGKYPITITASNSNYNVEVIDGTLTIKKRKVNIDIKDITKVFGDKDPIFEYTSSVDEIFFTGNLTREEGEKSGEYKILIGTLSAGDNYELILSDATLTIDGSFPPIAYVSLSFAALAVVGIIFIIIRKLLGAIII